MEILTPPILQAGDTMRVITPSRSLAHISERDRATATERFEAMGLNVTFGKHVLEQDEFNSSTIESRIEDLHDAFTDPNVKFISTVIGGFNCNQLLRYIDWDLIRHNPKAFCGYSDITALNNAIFAKTGLVSFSGPHFSSFGEQKGIEYTREYFMHALFSSKSIQVEPSTHWSDDEWFRDQENRDFIPNTGWSVLQEGEAEGPLLGGNLCTFNLLQGTEYMPDLTDSILFLEDDSVSNAVTFDRDLQSIIHQSGFEGVRGIVIGRFQKASEVSNELLRKIIESKRELRGIPVIANVDFGHTTPHITLPIGVQVRISAVKGSEDITLRV